MANPQQEHGHVRIANDLYDALLKYPFTATEIKVIFAVVRITYGWRKTKSQTTFYALSKMTNLDRSNLRKAVKKLQEDRILFLQTCVDGSFLIGLNKNYDEWWIR